MDEWPNFPEDYLNTRKHEIHVHLQILKREIDEIHEHLVHYQEPWISYVLTTGIYNLTRYGANTLVEKANFEKQL